VLLLVQGFRMLFNSYEFIFLFMPATVLGFALFSRLSHLTALLWLTAASFLFYVSWNPQSSWVLIVSIASNFFFGVAIRRSKGSTARLYLVCGVAADLFLLAIFKYAGFAVDTANWVTGSHLARPMVELPIGISFYTFTQIAYLADTYRRQVSDHNPLRYALFVTYFPHLIAGPIIHHRPVMQQLADPKIARLGAENWIIGLSFFSIGMAKKMLLADPLGTIASPLFAAAPTSPLSIVAGWVAAGAYTFQLYFDFSGYSDMAVGLSLLFGVHIPINFLSPYKARSIIEFWRTWHISLSTFLKDYLYIPLGGNRRGTRRRYLNLFVTMVLGGLWHGAGWNYVAWGALHGLYLLVNHWWREIVGVALWRPLARLLTFLAVMVGWVFFRSGDCATALGILKSMVSLSELREWAWAADTNLRTTNAWFAAGMVSLAAAIAFLAPNSLTITTALKDGMDQLSDNHRKLVFGWLAAYGLLLGISVVFIGRASPFLYFQF
jgi:alginate O-acetyltransferase complex protein AlgI